MQTEAIISHVTYTRAGIMILFAETFERPDNEEDVSNPWSGLATHYPQLLTSSGWSAISEDTYKKFTTS